MVKRKSKSVLEAGCSSCAPEGGMQNEGLKTNHRRVLNIRLGIGMAIYALAVIFTFTEIVSISLFSLSYLLIGGDIVFKALRNIMRGRLFDENTLMSVATMGAFAIREYPEAVAVMLFFQVGEYFQNMAVHRSRRSIAALMDIRPAYANLVKGDTITQVNPEEVVPGDIIILKPGERIPLDGKVVAGVSQMDNSALTGESVPVSVKPGDDLISGAINISGVLHMSVSRKYAESTVAKILELVQNAGSRKAPTEKFISKFARYYTPAVVSLALAIALVPPLVLPQALFSDWLYRALVFLVVSCPCALVISIPLSFFGGIGAASRNGILVKGGNFLEALNQVDTVVFDKTGTLTKGVFNVTAVMPEEGISREELLELAALAESYSHHPIAKSIRDKYEGEVLEERIEQYEEKAGYGIRSVIEGKTILVGNKNWMAANNVFVQGQDTTETIVHLAIDGHHAGRILIDDEIKEDAPRGIEGLKDLGVKRLIMLTGDGKHTAWRVARELAVEEVYAELLPHDKVEKMEEIYKAKGKGSLIYVGDGINDAPVIARADVGIAMGGLGSDAAIEAADVVLMTDEPSKLLTAIKIARQTRAIVWQNIVFALAVKGIIMGLGAFGVAGLWEAVFADVGVALLAILNAMRLLKGEYTINFGL